MPQTKHPETHTHTESEYKYTHAHTHTHTSVFLSLPASVREAQARSPMLREEPIENSVKYTVKLRTHTVGMRTHM
jgi:hypothetical protein